MTGRAADKTKSLGLDWPSSEETRQTHSQEDHRVYLITHKGRELSRDPSTPGGTQKWQT